ncbi:MAG: 30S ribosomal protein S3 [Patescibacteria group bacterium]
MTKIVHPYAHRLGGSGIRDWKARWFAGRKQYVEFLKTDTVVRDYLMQKLHGKYVSDIQIERDDKNYKIIIATSRSGMIIGRGGEGVNELKSGIVRVLKKHDCHVPENIRIEIEDIRNPEADAGIVAASVVEGLERRMPFRRVLKTTIEKSMANKEVLGIKITISGRLNGAEMSRREYLKRGRIPLQTLRADIDYRELRANLPYGVIGVKVWIYRGELFEKERKGS